ncbi:uncharacterized mitochondrial protein-like protein [Tanacetum coccineum]
MFQGVFEIFPRRREFVNDTRELNSLIHVHLMLCKPSKYTKKFFVLFYVGYYVVSKAMRVFNKRTRIVEETLNIRFLENTPNVKGNRPDWLFDVDSLTISMNYVPVVAGNQTNGIAGTKDNIVVGPKDSEGDAGIKHTEVDERGASDKNKKDAQDTRISTAGPSFDNVVPSPPVNTVGPSVSTANAFEEHLFERFSPFKNAFTLPPVPNVSSMDNTGIFGNAYDDEDLEEEVDMNNVISSYSDPDSSFTKFHKDYPEDQVIGSLKTHVQTRHMTKINEEHGLFSSVHKIRRTNHKDFQNCLFACFLSQMEPKKPVQALKDPSWVETMQDELPQFKLLKVWTLVDLPRDKHKNDIQLVQVYVDNIIFGSTKKEMSTKFEKLLHDKFQMSSMGELSFFLGLQVQQKSNEIFISQDKYVAEILKKFDFASVKTASTPIETNKALIKDEEAEDVDVHLYRSVIRSLMYFSASRPDIMFAVCACARFQVTPKTSHLNALKRIFRYLKGQPKLGIWYLRDSPFDLEAFSDSDYAGASLDMKSTTGGCQFLGKRLISWQCKKQTIVANSTTKAEYVAARSKSKEVETPRYLSLVVPLKKVGDEAIHKELSGRMERAATTASSLEAEQDSVNTFKSGEDSMQLMELMALCTKLCALITATIDGRVKTITEASIRRHLKLEYSDGIPTLPNAEIFEQLALMGYASDSDKLTFQKGNFSPQLRFLIHTILHCLSPKKTIWEQFSSNIATAIIYLATNRTFNFSKMIFEGKTSADTEILLEQEEPTELVEDYGSGEKGEKEISTAEVPVSTASAILEVSTAIPERQVYIRRSAEKRKDKGKAIMKDDESVQKKTKKQLEQERVRHEEAIRLQEQINKEERQRISMDAEIAKQLQEEIDIARQEQEKYDLAQALELQKEYHAQQNRYFSKAEVRKNMCMYLKNQGGYKQSHFRGMSYEDIKPIFEKVWDQNQAFVPKDSEIEKEPSRGSRKKTLARKKTSEKQSEEGAKRQKMEDDTEKDELKAYLDIVPGEEFAMDVESLSTNEMIDDFDRQDVMDLHRLVKERYVTTSPEGYDLMLWEDLKTLFELDEEDEVWRNQHRYNLISWRLIDSCGIHILLMDNGIAIHMMVEKKYPLIQEMLSKMLNRKLEIDHESEMATSQI